MTDQEAQRAEPLSDLILRYDTIGLSRLPVVRQLTTAEIVSSKRSSRFPEPTTTEEGFNIRGTNKTEDIRKLTTLQGEPVGDIDKRMKGNYLAHGEKFIDRLVADNDIVGAITKPDGNPLSHEDLFEATSEFVAVVDLMKKNRVSIFLYEKGTTKFRINVVDTLAGGGIDSDASSRSSRVYNLENGAAIYLNADAPKWIAYGFYEGDVFYRMEPKEVAEALSVMPIPDSDPVVQLINTPDTPVTITSRNQLRRIENLIRVIGDNIVAKPSIKIAPDSLATYAEAIRLAQAMKMPIETFIAEHVSQKPERGPITVGTKATYSGSHTDLDFFSRLDRLRNVSPNTAQELLDLISEISFVGIDPTQYNHQVGEIIRGWEKRISLVTYKRPWQTDVLRAINPVARKQENKLRQEKLNKEYADKPFIISLLSKIKDKELLKDILESSKKNTDENKKIGAVNEDATVIIKQFYEEIERVLQL